MPEEEEPKSHRREEWGEAFQCSKAAGRKALEEESPGGRALPTHPDPGGKGVGGREELGSTPGGGFKRAMFLPGTVPPFTAVPCHPMSCQAPDR